MLAQQCARCGSPQMSQGEPITHNMRMNGTGVYL